MRIGPLRARWPADARPRRDRAARARSLGLALRIYALVLCATAARRSSSARSAPQHIPHETPLREPAQRLARRRPPPSLERIEREVALGVAGSFDLHYRLARACGRSPPGCSRSRRQDLARAKPGRGARRCSATTPGSSSGPTGPHREDRLARGHRAAASSAASSTRWRRSDGARPGPGALRADVLDEVERAVVGKRERSSSCCSGILADGHVLLEDYPGLAKTLTARSFAQVAEHAASRASSSRPT